MVEFQSTWCWSSTKHISWKKTNIKILSLQSNSALLASLETTFEGVTPEDVEALAFLAKAVHHKRFQIKEVTTFDS